MNSIPAGWYDDPNGGPRRWWTGSEWADRRDRPTPEAPVTQVYDRSKWEQAPDGSWHRRSWWSRWGVLTVCLVVAAGIGGAGWWNWHQDQQRQEQMTDELVCDITGSC